MSRIIYAYLSLNKDYQVGKIFVDSKNGFDSISFEYADDFFKLPYKGLDLDPDLVPFRGRQYLNPEKEIFGFLSDACPDRWGRVLLRRREVELAKIESRKPKKLNEIDYLMGVFDASRMGALRFKEDPDGPFLANDEKYATPPWIFLRTLEKYARDFDFDETIDGDWVKNLLIPGSSLGGARPKANVYAPDGSIWLAKFPSKKDTYDVGAWEYVVNVLALKCGLNVPEFKLDKFSKYGSTFLEKRFDRNGGKRVHFQSAMTALSATDGESNKYSYLHIADYIKSKSSNPKKDLEELFKRVIFNMAINNIDDHLRNHGFIYYENGYRLSPLYDINPSPYGEYLSLNVTLSDSKIDTNNLFKTYQYYDLTKEKAVSIYNSIVKTVSENWLKEAKKINISRNSIEQMKTAFALKEIE